MKVFTQVDESIKRKLAAAIALDLGWGGISTVRKITDMSNTTIRKGIKELDDPERFEQIERIHKVGGGLK